MTALRAVGPLILAMTILQAGQGLMGVFFPLAMSADGLRDGAVGLVGAAYSAGFMVGAWVGPRMLARAGHIRLFAAFAAILAAGTLSLHWADGLWGWVASRAVMGVAVALMFAAVESWMTGAIPKAERGGVIGFYMVCTKAALAIGPFLASVADGQAAEPLMVAALVIALAVPPVCLTSAAQPEPPKGEPLALRNQFDTAPAAVIACFGAGFINAGVLTLAPLYAAAIYGQESASAFQASAWLGSLLLQWPAGLLSDRMDRRMVIAGLVALSAVAALALALMGAAPFWAAAAVFAVWGAGALSFYGVAVAHMADRAEPSTMARATSGLLFVWAAGSVIGPMTLGVVSEVFGKAALFWFAAIAGAALAGLMAWRRSARPAPAPATKESFAPKQATSIAAAEMAYGDDPKP